MATSPRRSPLVRRADGFAFAARSPDRNIARIIAAPLSDTAPQVTSWGFFRSAALRRIFYILGALLLLSRLMHHAHASELAIEAAPLLKGTLAILGG